MLSKHWRNGTMKTVSTARRLFGSTEYPPITFSPEVAAARDKGLPIVALESTIIRLKDTPLECSEYLCS